MELDAEFERRLALAGLIGTMKSVISGLLRARKDPIYIRKYWREAARAALDEAERLIPTTRDMAEEGDSREALAGGPPRPNPRPDRWDDPATP
jgi:hypothetical protein